MTCPWCSQPLSDDVDGCLPPPPGYSTLPYGSEPDLPPPPERCRDCGVLVGRYHHSECFGAMCGHGQQFAICERCPEAIA